MLSHSSEPDHAEVTSAYTLTHSPSAECALVMGADGVESALLRRTRAARDLLRSHGSSALLEIRPCRLCCTSRRHRHSLFLVHRFVVPRDSGGACVKRAHIVAICTSACTLTRMGTRAFRHQARFGGTTTTCCCVGASVSVTASSLSVRSVARRTIHSSPAADGIRSVCPGDVSWAWKCSRANA